VVTAFAGCKDLKFRLTGEGEDQGTSPLPRPTTAKHAPESAPPAKAAAESAPVAAEQPAPAPPTESAPPTETKPAAPPAPAAQAGKAPQPEPEPKAPLKKPEDISLADIADLMVQEAEVDCRVVEGHIKAAQRLLSEGESSKASQAILAALRASAFVRSGLPSVLARECLERAIAEIDRGRPAKAEAAVDAAAKVSSQVTLRGTGAEFRRLGTQAIDLVKRTKPDEARGILRDMIEMIASSDSDVTASRLSDNLVGALSAVDRDARSVAQAELTEADAKVGALLRTIQKEY
jgi:hypothetical protein